MFHIDEGSGKNDPESVSGTGSSPNVNQFSDWLKHKQHARMSPAWTRSYTAPGDPVL